MTNIQVALADDHGIVRHGLRLLIEGQADMSVVGEVSNGADALSFVESTPVDVLVLDLSMSTTGGLQVLEELRRRELKTRSLVLTMHEDHFYVRAVLAAGGAGYLAKSAAHTELVQAIRCVHAGRSYLGVELNGSALSDLFGEPETTGEKKATAALSKREREVLRLVAHGYTTRRIAERLGVGVKTIETYRARMAEKLGLRDRVELVRYAIALGLVDSESP